MKRRAFLGTALAGLPITGAFAAQPTPKAGDIPTTPRRLRLRRGQDDVRSCSRRARQRARDLQGIPYGGSVSGPNRFKAAPPLKPWSDVRDALTLGPPSPQPGRRASNRELAPAEDCLVLNVWTPAADGQKRPVMFYSHGGGFVTGSGGSATRTAGISRAPGTWWAWRAIIAWG